MVDFVSTVAAAKSLQAKMKFMRSVSSAILIAIISTSYDPLVQTNTKGKLRDIVLQEVVEIAQRSDWDLGRAQNLICHRT
jgi:hypothetical protein